MAGDELTHVFVDSRISSACVRGNEVLPSLSRDAQSHVVPIVLLISKHVYFMF